MCVLLPRLESIHGRKRKIPGARLKQDAVSTKGFEALTELFAPTASGVILKAKRMRSRT